jgi:DNA-binding IclR family transcriptional regulator
MEFASVLRVVGVFNFFVEHPRQSFTIAQVVRSLKLSRSTCVNIMNGLVEAGYLYRNTDRTYVLGPAILRIARQARIALTPLDIARLEIRRLADRLDAIVAVHARENGEVVLRERAVSSRYLSLAHTPSVRFPVQSFGVLFLCPLPDPEIEVIFDRTDPPLALERRDAQRKAIAFARRHGFIFGLRPDGGTSGWGTLIGEGAAGDFALGLEAGDLYRLQYILAPVLDPQGHVAFQFSVSGFEGEYSGTEIAEIAAKVRESCGRVTTFLTGKQVFDFGTSTEPFPALPKLEI